MNVVIRLAIILCFMGGALAVQAQQNIAVVDIELAIANSNHAKTELDKLKQSETFKKNFEEYNRLSQEIKTFQEQAKVNSLTWSEEQKQQYKIDIETKVAQINNIGGLLDREKSNVERQIEKDMKPKIEKIVNEIIQEKSIGLLFNARDTYYRSAGFDITKELVERLNQAQ